MKISTLLLVLLAQFSGCARFLCSLSFGDQFRSRPLPIAIPSVEDIAPISQDDLLVAARPLRTPTAMELTRVSSNHEEMIASTPALLPYDLKPSLFSNGERWWFSRQGDEGLISSVFFVAGDGERIQQTRVKLPRKSLFVDERHNGCGQVADYYIDILRRPFISNWAMRYRADLRTPLAAIQGPKAMIIDETAGSGGDLLPWMFRKLQIGPLIGRRTWGGLVGILGFPVLMDGGTITAPNLAIWTDEGSSRCRDEWR